MIALYVLAVIWVVRIVLNLFSYIHLWFVKEYRIDRMLIHLKTKQGRRILFLPWKRPPFGPKSLFITIAGLSICVWLYVTLPVFFLLKLFLLDIMLFPITLLLVSLLTIPTALYHRLLINRAVAQIRAHKKMKVIGITGSFGKTSTKEMLYTLVSQKYSTLKTEASKNSPIAIAELILSQLRDDHEVFIVEMGAYKIGEIARMCTMVQPEIGIVTAVNAQHQDLFGSIENTMKAKYELIEGLSGDAAAIVNADNQYTKQMSDWALRDGRKLVSYSADAPATLHASQIAVTRKGVSCTVLYRNQTGVVSVPLLGRHHISNILAAIAGALNVGMTFDEAIEACKKIHSIKKTMMPVAGIHGSVFIDDTFNNNPDAARAALDYLSTTEGRKLFVFQPMIELGAYAKESHSEVGSYAAKICDDIILTNDNYFESFIKGVRKVDPNTKVSVRSPGDSSSYLRKLVKKGDTVLFKGKESGRILDNLV